MNPILVVGVRGGVGAAVAQQLIAQGRSVIGTVRSAEQFDEIRAALPGLADLIAVDMDNPQQSRDVLAQRFGAVQLDGVIVCAAISVYGPLETFPLDQFRQVLDVNTISCLAIYQACVPALRRAQGRLVLVSSYSGRMSFPFFGVYQASKAALESLGDTLRQEAGEFGVKVILVEPGGIDTEMSRAMRRRIDGEIAALPAEENQRYGHLYRQFRERVHGAVNLPSGADVAREVLIAFNALDPESRYAVGDDTKFLLEQRRILGDREFDALLKSL